MATLLASLATFVWAAQEGETPGDPPAAGDTAPTTEDAGPATEDAAPETATPAVVHITLDSIIHPIAAQFVLESLEHADGTRAAALLIELNTPGGLLESTREIFKAMLTARTPVVVYVGPSGARAASAGFFLLMAADVAAMAPGTNTGAAHPVAGQGKDIEGDLGAKVEQDAAATIRSLAAQHGRNVELAEAAVVESRSFTAEEALESKLIDLVAVSVPQLLTAIDGRTVVKAGETEIRLATAAARIEKREMRPFQRFLAVLIHPEIAYILMTLGFIGLYMELSNPGAVLPGVVGAICLILGFYSLSVLPINYAGVGLLVLALVFFLAEIYTPTFGALTMGGVIALVLGSVMLFKDADPALRAGLDVIVGTTGALLLVVLLLLRKAYQVRGTRVVTGVEGLLGERGVARTDIGAADKVFADKVFADKVFADKVFAGKVFAGKVFVHGELWRATADEPVPAGTPVEVIEVRGLELRVRAVAVRGVDQPS